MFEIDNQSLVAGSGLDWKRGQVMASSTVRVLVLAVWTLLMVTLIQRVSQARLVSLANFNLLQNSLMDPRLWEPAAGLLSKTFAGTNIAWIGGPGDAWTLPGADARRTRVEHGGRELLNHQQFTARTKRDWGPFHLQVNFKFDGEEGTETRLEQFGNSGIYIYGLYEVQIVNTSRFLDPGPLSSKNLRGGRVQATVDGRKMEAAAPQVLCGSIYDDGDSDTDPLAGTTTDKRGRPFNFCNPSGQWNRLDVFFTPPAFQNGQKTHYATIATFINGRRVHYGGREKYGIPHPTGSQRKKADRVRGPIVIQDHGGKVSFRAMQIDAGWRPRPNWGVAVRTPRSPPRSVARVE